MMRSVQQLTSHVLGTLAVLGLAGCSGLEPVTTYDPITDPTQLYMKLRLDHRGVTLSTDPSYNTVQLTATPRNALGEAMVGLPAPTFRSGDTSAVIVTSDGLVQALKVAGQVKVIAELRTSDNVRHADTALIQVTSTATPPQLGSVSIHPESPDSAIMPILPSNFEAFFFSFFNLLFGGALNQFPLGDNGGWLLQPRALSTTGDPISDLLFSYELLDDPAIATINRTTGEVIGLRPGLARFVVQTMAYGIEKVDTATYTITRQTFYDIAVTDTGGFQPNRVHVGKNAIVSWIGRAPVSMDVTFDDPTHVAEPPAAVCAPGWVDGFGAAPDPNYCGAGDILPFMGGGGSDFFDVFLPDGTLTGRMRQFPVPGVYTYRNTFTGATGTIEVVE